jgi:6-phospho-beta-glucosidase
MGVKIVTIGGGSSYTPELVEGFIKRYDELPVSELWLVDIEEGKEKLEIVGDLARRMVKKANVPMEIHTTLDRRRALVDADFVTTQIRVGQLEARAKDERIPILHEVMGQETNGPGGLFKGLRTIPVIFDIIDDVKELCPDAWLINFANPAGMITEAVYRHTDFKKFIGLCNVPIHIHMNIAELMGVEKNRITFDFAGLNHMVYGLDVYLDGKSIKQEVIDKLLNPETEDITMNNIAKMEWEKEFIQALNLIPCPYHKYYYKETEMLEDEIEKAKKNITRAEQVIEIEKSLFEKYKNPDLNEKPKELEERGGAYYSDAACEVINAIYNDKQEEHYVNIPNAGHITNLPSDVTVEMTCVVGKNGATPVERIKEIPAPVLGLIMSIKAFEIQGAKAALSGDYSDALLAMNINPLVHSDHTAKIVMDELLEAHKHYLPRFFKEEV